MGDTESFLRLLNESNARIAAMEAAKADDIPQPDEVRLQREKERREKWGQLRAREHASKRPKQARSVFGYVDPT